MNVLLDTHVILWIAFNSEKLSKNVIKILTLEDTRVFISSASFWEISLKYQSGKLNLNNHTPSSLLKIIKENFSFEPLDVVMMDTATLFELKSNHHKDPFDRLLIW